MKYNFERVKQLYDEYGITKSINSSEQLEIFNRRNNIRYDFNSEFAQDVKFAHTWVAATKFNHSSSSPTSVNNKITEEEYIRAFNENAKEAFNIIVSTSILCLQAVGRMPKYELLEKELKKSSNYAHAVDIAKGLYSKPNGYESFELWCRNAAKKIRDEDFVYETNNKYR